ncbi:MAG: hypothetical protein H0U76_22385 [Ktedonobacteraceae bacterium]|nr:hypothetical protein [Ktedonobacteraceae bacterium]
MENHVSQGQMALTDDALKQLPDFVAAMVRDYSTGDGEQLWTLRDLNFDTQTLDDLPVGEHTTCEIWTDGWAWRGSAGGLSLSPQIVRPDDCPAPEIFAWIIERGSAYPQHITVWRVRAREQDNANAQCRPVQEQSA